MDFIFFVKNKEKIGKNLLKCLIDLGPGYVKFGQALSTRPDLLGKNTCEHLKILQDNIVPFYFCKKILKQKLKVKSKYLRYVY